MHIVFLIQMFENMRHINTLPCCMVSSLSGVLNSFHSLNVILVLKTPHYIYIPSPKTLEQYENDK